MDVYRTGGDVESLGLEEYYHKNGVVIIEWAEMIPDYLPDERLDITFKITGEDSRVMVIEAHGDKYISMCDDAL